MSETLLEGSYSSIAESIDKKRPSDSYGMLVAQGLRLGLELFWSETEKKSQISRFERFYNMCRI